MVSSNDMFHRTGEIKHQSDFKSWSKRDLSEAFWVHLGLYVKSPNEHSLSILRMAFLWACHDDQGLANSFSHALKWCNVDLYPDQDE